jgi:hypothetical protein
MVSATTMNYNIPVRYLPLGTQEPLQLVYCQARKLNRIVTLTLSFITELD